MEIKGIKNINTDDRQWEILIKINPEDRVASRWELVNPMVQALYNPQKQQKVQLLQLLDEGMAVHGYEFTKEEDRMITEYIEKEIESYEL